MDSQNYCEQAMAEIAKYFHIVKEDLHRMTLDNESRRDRIIAEAPLKTLDKTFELLFHFSQTLGDIFLEEIENDFFNLTQCRKEEYSPLVLHLSAKINAEILRTYNPVAIQTIQTPNKKIENSKQYALEIREE